MPVIARRTGKVVSDNAKERIVALRQYPTVVTFRNPLTRAIARHFAHEAWLKALEEIDFEYRLTDIEINEVPCVAYETGKSDKNNPLILYIHGGGFVCGSPRVNAATVLPACELSGCEAIGIDYTLVPEAFYPTQINEIDSVYSALIEQHPNRKIVLLSDSAGGTLTLAALMRWRDQGKKLPAGAVFISPLLDGAGASDTNYTNDGHDPLIRSMNGKEFRRLYDFYAPGEKLNDPNISPIYGDFSDLPPILAQVGTREVVLGDSARFIESARRAGGDVTLRLFDGMFHLFHMHWTMEETKIAYSDMANFIGSLNDTSNHSADDVGSET